MRGVLKWLMVVVGVFLLATISFFVTMRFHDGPIQIVSGGPFKTGTAAPLPGDWSFLKDTQTIQFQTTDPASSRNTWCAVYDGRLFVVSGYMTTGWGKLWKQWPHYIERDNRVILRIDGKLYEARMIRIREGDVVAPVMAEFGRKYGFNGTGDSVASGYSWLYEVKPR